MGIEVDDLFLGALAVAVEEQGESISIVGANVLWIPVRVVSPKAGGA